MIVMLALGTAHAQDAPAPDSPRIALVIGIGAYRNSPLPTAANDAGLVAQTLAAAGFDVTGARDLDGASLRRTIHDFLDKASAGGPRGVAVVYLAGHALQADGENYFAPTDANLDRASGVAIDTFRLADLTRALAATNLGAKVVIIDGAHADPRGTGPLAGGLALVDAEQGSLLAFNTAPGTLAPIEPGPYGTYARILTQNMKQGGVPVDEMFDRLRVAVNTATGGTVVPWNVSKLLQNFTFFDRADNAPALGSAQVPFTSLRTRPLRDFSPEQAYDVALARDTLNSYQDYLAAFPDHPLARRIRTILAIRREAMFWRDALKVNSAAAYWTYLRRYSHAPHGAEAERRLSRLAAGKAPPADFVPLAFDVPPPADVELLVLDRHGLVVESDLIPPPPPPLFLLPPFAPDGDMMQPPPPAPGVRFLPLPVALPIPFVRPIIAPGIILPPRGVTGAYRQPRPFAPGASNGGLVPRNADMAPGNDNHQANPRPAPLAQTMPTAPVPPKAPQLPVVPAPAEPQRPEEPGKAPALGDAHPLPKPSAPAPMAHPVAAPAPAPLPGSPPPLAGTKGAGAAKPKDRPVSPPAVLPANLPPPAPGPIQPAGLPAAKSQPKLRQSPGQAQAPAIAKPHPQAPGLAPAAAATAPRVVVPTRPVPVVAPKPQLSEPKKLVAPERPTEAAVPHAPAGEAHRNGRPECGHPGQPPCHP